MCELCKAAVGIPNAPPTQLNPKIINGYRCFLTCRNCGFGANTNATIFILIPKGTKKNLIDLTVFMCPHCGCDDSLVS